MKRDDAWYPVAIIAATLFLTPPPAFAGPFYVPAVREMTERRSATERHYLLADGTYRAEVNIQPLHYKATNGIWQPIETNLSATAKEGFAASNETNTLKTYLPATAGAPVRVEAETGALTFQLLGGFNGPATVQGNHVSFADSQNNADISYAVEPGQLKELITLNALAAAPVFRYAMNLAGLTATLKPDNSVGLEDATGQVVMRISAPWMVDATGKSSGRLKVALNQTPEGLVYSISPDATWLASARYPVTIDPTITAYPNWTASNAVGEYQNDSFWSPGFDYYGDYSSEGSGPYLAVGAPYASVPYRSLLSFNISGLPLDSEVQAATMTLYADHATGDPSMQVRIYEADKTLDPEGSSDQYPTPTNIGVTMDELSIYPSVTAPLGPNFWGANKNFDVTALAQYWADSRSEPLHLLIRDAQEDLDSYSRSSAVVFFTASSSSLSLNYTTPGWYMLQGNNRHSGHTQYPLASNLNNVVSQWSAPAVLPTPSPGDLPSGYPPVEIQPSMVAVPNPADPSSSLPVLYVAVNSKKFYNQGTTGDNRLWRIEDGGSTHAEKICELGGIQVTGAPVVIGTQLTGGIPGHKVVIAGCRRTSDEYGVTVNEGHVIRYDVTGSGQNAVFTEIWHYVFNAPLNYQQAVFASPGYCYTTTAYQNENGASRSYTGGVILVTVKRTDNQDYVIALALDTMNATGQNVWGRVNDSTGELVYYNAKWGDLPPLSDFATQDSSPAVSIATQRAFVITGTNDYPRGQRVVGREIHNGAVPSPGWFAGDGPEAAQAVSVLGDRFFLGRDNRAVGWLDIPGAEVQQVLSAYTPGQTDSIVGSPTFFPEDHTAIVACNSDGTPVGCGLFGVATDGIVQSPVTTRKWSSTFISGHLTFGAPVVAGSAAAGNTYACMASYDSQGAGSVSIYGLLAPNQGSILRTLSPISGLIWANLAAFGAPVTGRCRLYVASGGIDSAPYNSRTVYCFAQ